MTPPTPTHRPSHRPEAAWINFAQTYPRRAFLLMSLGGVAGLIIAGVGLFQAKGTSTLIVPADAVAVVNQQPIARVDHEAELRGLGLEPAQITPAVRRKALDGLIREELYVQRGKELDVAQVDPDVRGAMVRAVESQAAMNALTSTPSEAELKAYYDAHRAKYASEGTMVVRDLVFPAASAAAARQRLAGGGAPEQALAQFGGRETGAVKGEEYYFAAKIHLGDALFAAARPLGDGAVSQPIPASDGAHVLVMVRNNRPAPYDFAEARPQVVNDRQSEAIARFQKAEEGFLRKRANVLIAEDMR